MLPLRWHATPPGAELCRTASPFLTGPAPVADPPTALAEGALSPSTQDAHGATTPAVVVRMSTRRRKTATALWEDGRIVVVLPSHVRRADRQELVDWLVARVLAKQPRAARSDDDLARRAAALADRYVEGVRPASIRWVTNQAKRWGSCSTDTGHIRLSHRLRSVPEWVLDATIVHELAHLLHADHSPAFHTIADRFPRQRDALVFLEGYSLGLRTTPS